MRYLLVLSIFICLPAVAQITAIQQQALNACVDYANGSASEVSSVVQSLMNFYPGLHRNNSWGVPDYVCPVQPEDYYFNQALALTKNLSVTHYTALSTRVKDLHAAAEAIDENCKT